MRTLAAIALFASLAAADTTLYIPGFDPQAITANNVGTDASGHTTWVIGPGVTSGTYEDAPGIEHSATLVAGATDAHLVYNDPVASVSLSEDCAINGGLAVCTAVAAVEGSVESLVVTETATGFVVQGAASGPTASATGSGSSSSPTAGSGVKSGASATGSSTAAATTTGGSNGAGRMQTSLGLSVGMVGLVAAFFL
ncbi:hypothetical protein GSI_14092 [Ganoderma sinense ZZ0214-1]|uniref:Uncharacterized protein n=1 Tax=Ganoderma sinense ZZ0214-1 TaxID=1077348 RepID=A0A2G8RS49_9APHY|nr:hypothetical protein GSI_14092 [Ganoderma sinense ZZ0214-1]